MTLQFTPQVETVEFPGGSISVRGLSFPDVSKLVDVHREAIIPLFDKYSGRKSDKIITEEAGAIILDVITAAPLAIGTLISIAGDCENQLETVVKIPMGGQADIVTKIAELTFKTNGGAGNLMAVVGRLVQQAIAESKKNLPQA